MDRNCSRVYSLLDVQQVAKLLFALVNCSKTEGPRTIIGDRRARYNQTMPVFDEKQEELEHFETMMGVPRGRLAVALDTVTDAMALVGQHGVYCQSQRWPGKPVMDIQIVMKQLTDAKELIQSVMEELKKPA